MTNVCDSHRRPFDSELQIGVAERRFRDSELRNSVSKRSKIDPCRHGVTYPGVGQA